MLTVSIGIAVANSSDDLSLGYAKFLNVADEALYAAKRGGRNRTDVGHLPPAA